MTKVYNVTNYGIEKQLESKLEKIEVDVKDDLQENKKSLKSVVIHDQVYLEALGKKSKITYFKVPAKNKKGYVLVTRKELFKIAEIINERVFFLFPSLKYIYDYLISISKLMIKLQIPLNWFTPNGIKVTQSYMKTEAKRVSIKLGQKSKVLVVRKTTGFVDTAKQAQAIIPNMIHSLDATHLINIINNASESKTLSAVPVISVHDCFGTLPNKMADLELLVKKEFINLYTKTNFLQKFHDRVILSIKDHNYEVVHSPETSSSTKLSVMCLQANSKEPKYLPIADLPEQGYLNGVVRSQYFIC